MTFEEWLEQHFKAIFLCKETDRNCNRIAEVAREAWEAAYDNGCQDTLDEVFGHKEEIEDDQ